MKAKSGQNPTLLSCTRWSYLSPSPLSSFHPTWLSHLKAAPRHDSSANTPPPEHAEDPDQPADELRRPDQPGRYQLHSSHLPPGTFKVSVSPDFPHTHTTWRPPKALDLKSYNLQLGGQLWGLYFRCTGRIALEDGWRMFTYDNRNALKLGGSYCNTNRGTVDPRTCRHG